MINSLMTQKEWYSMRDVTAIIIHDIKQQIENESEDCFLLKKKEKMSMSIKGFSIIGTTKGELLKCVEHALNLQNIKIFAFQYCQPFDCDREDAKILTLCDNYANTDKSTPYPFPMTSIALTEHLWFWFNTYKDDPEKLKEFDINIIDSHGFIEYDKVAWQLFIPNCNGDSLHAYNQNQKLCIIPVRI